MKNYTSDELNTILINHNRWLKCETGGIRADLSGANLSGAYLSGADLSGADLSGADLSGAYLIGANLREANLIRADLSGAYLIGADLSRANLSGANLSKADLSGANLSKADLREANLSGADLREANLSGANLSKADLREANLSKKEWQKLKNRYSIVTPDTRFVFKKLQNGIIAYLEIPKEAKRSNAFSRKCRVSEVKVIKLIDSNGNEVKEGFSCYDSEFKYTPGAVIKPINTFDDNWYNECGSGIHFFLTESEAKEFEL